MGPDSRQRYERLWARGWSKSVVKPGASYRSRRRLFLGCLARVYRPGVSVLDLGCGSGALLLDIRRRFPRAGPLWGTDISDTALELARNTLPEGRFLQCDLDRGRPPVEEMFDIVTCSEVLEHVQSPEAVLGHAADVMKPGGALVVSVPHSMRHWGPHDEGVHHLRRFEKVELCAALRAAGLEPVHVFTWGCFLYDAYYRLLLNKVEPASTWKPKGPVSRLAHAALYRLFFVDDLFRNAGTGRMLFATARKA